MKLPVLPLKAAVERPAESAKTYDAMWVYSLSILAPDPGMTSGRIVIEYYPMVSGTGELKTDELHRISTDQLWQLVGTVPEVGTALGAVLAAIKPIEAALEAMEPDPLP